MPDRSLHRPTVTFLLFVILLPAQPTGAPAEATSSATQASTATTAPTPTSLPTATRKPAPTQFSPAPAGTAVPLAEQEISPANITRLREVAIWGYGYANGVR